MFISHDKVRMHDTDMAGILYFARQFRFVHDALEELLEQEGIFFDRLFDGSHDYTFVVVHVESDYLAALKVADKLTVHVQVEKIGTTSFTMGYKIYRGAELVGTAKTVHVVVDPNERTKLPIPEGLKQKLLKYYQPE